MKQKVLLSCMLMLMSVGLAHGQTAYTYVQQNGTAIAADGLAGFDLSSSPSVEFVNGKAVMTIGGNTVATLPMSNGGQLVVECEKPTTTGIKDLTVNEVPVTVTSAGYGTFYSPFQIHVPEGGNVKVYAPIYNEESSVLTCNSTTEKSGVVIAPNTGLLLKNAGDITFKILSGDYEECDCALSGTALKIPTSDVALNSGEVLLTLGKGKNSGIYGFYQYTGDYLNASKAYFVFDDSNSAGAKYVSLKFDDEATGISNTDVNADFDRSYKYVENGRVIIVKNGKKYNANGQKIK